MYDVIEEQLAAPSGAFKIDAATGGTIEGKAVRFTIAGGAIVDEKGAAVTGPVQIDLREFAGVGDMVRSGRFTNGGGELLTPRGAFVLWASDERGQELEVRTLQELAIRRLDAEPPELAELWTSGRDDHTWTRHDPPLQASVMGDEYVFTDVVLPPEPNFAQDFNRSRSNKDRGIMVGGTTDGKSPLMTLKVRLEPSLAANSAALFLPDDEPIVAGLHIRDSELPGLVSSAGSMPSGEQGKLIVVGLVGGRFYLHHDEGYVIPTGTPGPGEVPEATIDISPAEVPEAEFMAYLAGL